MTEVRGVLYIRGQGVALPQKHCQVDISLGVSFHSCPLRVGGSRPLFFSSFFHIGPVPLCSSPHRLNTILSLHNFFHFQTAHFQAWSHQLLTFWLLYSFSSPLPSPPRYTHTPPTSMTGNPQLWSRSALPCTGVITSSITLPQSVTSSRSAHSPNHT